MHKVLAGHFTSITCTDAGQKQQLIFYLVHDKRCTMAALRLMQECMHILLYTLADLHA